MHKDKKGKVYASLTEVKNKTGDIFALVDEFGEVYITSYNKTRYKISKMNISSLLGESEEKVEKPKETPKAEKLTTTEKTQTVHHNKEVQKTTHPKDDEVHQSISINAYDRNNRSEIDFINNALQPLVNN